MSSAAVAHLNVARLRAMPGDPLVAGFVDNVTRINAVAERSDGFIWRFDDVAFAVGSGIPFQALGGDPLVAISLSMWESVEHLYQFVHHSAHGGYLRRRERWFEPMSSPNYVLWTVPRSHRPTLDEGVARLGHLTEHGVTPEAFDFSVRATTGREAAAQHGSANA